MQKKPSGERAIAQKTPHDPIQNPSIQSMPSACPRVHPSKRIAARFITAALCIGHLSSCNLDSRVRFPSHRPPPISSAEEMKKPEPPKSAPNEPLEPTAYVPTADLLNLPVMALPHLDSESIRRSRSRPDIIWVGSSISYGALDHATTLSALLKGAINKGSSVACHPQGGAGIRAISGNMEEELSGGRFNTVVFEAGVNDLHGIVGRVMDGSITGEHLVNDAVDKAFAMTVKAAKSALGKGKLLILLTVSPWGGYQPGPDAQKVADDLTDRFNIQIQRLHDPINGVFVVDTRLMLGASDSIPDLQTNPPAGWQKGHSYSPSRPFLWLKSQYREMNVPEDPRTGYLHPNRRGHVALGDALAEQVYGIKPPRRSDDKEPGGPSGPLM